MAKTKKKQKKKAQKSSQKTKIKPIKRSYDAARSNRLLSDWVAPEESANMSLYKDLRVLRRRCRQLVQNDAYASGAINTLLANILGEKGFNYQARFPKLRGEGLNDDVNMRIERVFEMWSYAASCDVRGLCDFNQSVRQALRSWLVDGDVLIEIVRKAFGPQNSIEYALKILEADYFVDDREIKIKGKRVKLGVQLDENDRVEGYWVYRRHPHDMDELLGVGSQDVRFIPAEDCFHLFFRDRPGQLRGVPVLASAALRLKFLEDIESAELVAAKLSALTAGFIETEDIESFGDSVPDNTDDECCDEKEQYVREPEIRSIEPGTVEHLLPGEKFSGFAPTRPNTALPEFTRHILRGISSALGIGYSSLSHDYANASYSSHRAEKLAEIRMTRFIQDQLKSQFCEPVSADVIETAWLQNLLNIPGFLQYTNPRHFHQWLCPGFDWIDPEKDIRAASEAIAANLSTFQMELGKRNLDWHEVLRQRAEEKAEIERLGLSDEEAADAVTATELQEGISAVRTEALQQVSNLESRILSSQSENRTAEVAVRAIEVLGDAMSKPSEGEPGDSPAIAALSPLRGGDRMAKNCTKGKPCGGSCQSKRNVCFIGLSADQKSLALKARRAIKAGLSDVEGVSSELPGGGGGGASGPAGETAATTPSESTTPALEPVTDESVPSIPEVPEGSIREQVAIELEGDRERLEQLRSSREEIERNIDFSDLDADDDAISEEMSENWSNLEDARRELRGVRGRDSEARQRRKDLIEAIAEEEVRERELHRRHTENQEAREERKAPLREVDDEIIALELSTDRRQLALDIATDDDDYEVLIRGNTLSRDRRLGAVGRGRDAVEDDDLSAEFRDKAVFDDFGRIRDGLITGEDGVSHIVRLLTAEDDPPSFARTSRESFDYLDENWNGKTRTVSFFVDGNTEDAGLGQKDAIRASLAVRQLWREQAAEIEPGTIVGNTPVGGPGGKRDRAYQKMGFGRTGSTNFQYAIMGENNRLIPIELEPIAEYEFVR